MLDIYKEPMENPKIPAINNTQEHIIEVCAAKMHILSNSMP